MQNHITKKIIVWGLIFIVTSLSITSCTGYNIRKNSGQIENENPFISLYDDYVNAWWKFDEGYGIIAYDSSGNDYHGNIIDATWTTNTKSGSGYALNFDGSNDYVELDTHSENLGFNKTDDMIFSFSFVSTSTNKGMFYSTSADSGTNPEWHIFLQSNGTIGIQIKVTYCGFTLHTEGTYNNGVWHDVEIWYNGISNEPTVKIFVDGGLDTEITDWVCPFENTEFTLTKIGQRSHEESDYFKGIIDEFKIIKFPGGNKQEPPEISGPISGESGEEYEYTFITNDPEEDDIWLWIDWDDGDIEEWIGPYESGVEVTVNHTWKQSGRYEIRAKSKDIWHDSHSSYYEVLIGNQPPEKPEINGVQLGEVGEVLDYTFMSTDYEGEDVEYYIDWGDESNTDWIGPYKSGEEITISHGWDAKGDYTIMAKARDEPGGESDWSLFMLRIGNEAPGAPDITGTLNGNPEKEYEFSFFTIDPEGDDIYYYIEWGDGTIDEWIGPFGSNEEVKIMYNWTNEGEYTIKAKAKDVFNAEGPEGTLKVNMPKHSFAPNNSILEYLMKFLQYLIRQSSNFIPFLNLVFNT